MFSWTVFDYPLKQAIIDNVVKRPLKGIAQGITEQRSDIASTRYQAYLAAGVERWKEYREQLAPLSKKPVLFVMMNDTAEADDVGDWLRKKYPSEFGGEKLLIIHTDRSGEVSKKDLDVARKASREVDDERSPINCIVSVMMLREGWDVQSVTVIVGLRPYTSKANILPEQTVGRGLRLMFRGQTGYIERVDVIGNKTFIEFVEQLEREEDIQLETFNLKEKVSIITIAPDPKKKDKDIAIPVLSPILTRKKSLAEEIGELDVKGFDCPVLPTETGRTPRRRPSAIEGYDIITLQKLVEREYKIPEPQTAEEVIGYLRAPHRAGREAAVAVCGAGAEGARVSRNEGVRCSGRAERAGDDQGDQQQRGAIRHGEDIRRGAAQAGGCGTGAAASPRRTATVGNAAVSMVAPDAGGRQIDLQSRALRQRVREGICAVPAEVRTTCSASPSCRSSSALLIEYTDSAGNLRYYEPDFVVLTSDGTHYIVETKGLEDINVANKDRARNCGARTQRSLPASRGRTSRSCRPHTNSFSRRGLRTCWFSSKRSFSKRRPLTAAAARSGLRCPSAGRPSSAPARRTGRRAR